MRLPKRRSSSNSGSTRTCRGRARLPPPTTIGARVALRSRLQLPDLLGLELPHDPRPRGGLVEAPTVEVRADRPLEVVDERVHLLVRLGPVETAVVVLDATRAPGRSARPLQRPHYEV